MAMYMRYMGEFLSRSNVCWRVEIYQQADTAFSTIGSLTFDADGAVMIEWADTSKEEVMCGSTATVQIISPSDRTYEDLYTIAVGDIRADIYRDSVLYWSGLLDPEFYEEPYERYDGYTVSLTFSDFGILDRLKYQLTGVQTLSNILLTALDKSGIQYRSVDYTTYVTTTSSEITGALLDGLSIRSDNFIDEEGEESTLKEVLEGILQPLSLRMIQRSGRIFIYDLNGLYLRGEQRALTWDGDSQTMGVDKVYNNVKITFSPYSSSELLSTEIDYTGKYDTTMLNVTINDPQAHDGDYWTFYPSYSEEDLSEDNQGGNVNFTIFIGESATGLMSCNLNRVKYFHILPLVNGPTECSGIAWHFRVGHCGYQEDNKWAGGNTRAIVNDSVQNTYVGDIATVVHTPMMTTESAYLPYLAAGYRQDYYLRIILEMLLDPRYNPFEQSGDYNEKGNYNEVETKTGFAFVPVRITLAGDDGKTYHYDNSNIAENYSQYILAQTMGSWVEGDGSFGDAWLEYYDPDDLEEKAGILGWAKNRQCVGRPDGHYTDTYVHVPEYEVTKTFKNLDEGQYIPYPPVGGMLYIEVFEGVNCFDYGNNLFNGDNTSAIDNTITWNKNLLYSKCRWLLYKAPTVELVRNTLTFDDADLDDIEYNAHINTSAKEELSIDTICGSLSSQNPTARGVYLFSDTGQQVTYLTRQREGDEITDHPEMLYIGTIYSQFADRRTTLAGDAQIDTDGLCVFTERNQGDKRFLITGEEQDLIADTSDVTIVELRPDEYEEGEE